MISTVMFLPDGKMSGELVPQIKSWCPKLNVKGNADCIASLQQFVFWERPDLLIIALNAAYPEKTRDIMHLFPLDCELIFISANNSFVMDAIRLCAAGYIIEPVQQEDLLIAVENAEKRINLKQENKNNKMLLNKMLNKFSASELIGVPTVSGLDFLPAEEIVRCEGLQKCTQIFTHLRPRITSSYNLGEFRKLLEPFGFFSPHKSHLINLNFIKQYKKEGLIIMTDDTAIPISRRKKTEFLDSVTCVRLTSRSEF